MAAPPENRNEAEAGGAERVFNWDRSWLFLGNVIPAEKLHRDVAQSMIYCTTSRFVEIYLKDSGSGNSLLEFLDGHIAQIDRVLELNLDVHMNLTEVLDLQPARNDPYAAHATLDRDMFVMFLDMSSALLVRRYGLRVWPMVHRSFAIINRVLGEYAALWHEMGLHLD